MSFARRGLLGGLALSAVLSVSVQAAPIDPLTLRKVATVDPRFQSYNVEMVEVTGGRFWKPYRLGPPKDADDRYAYRPPVDLANARLRRLAGALGPVYIRISGTWASATYIAARDSVAAPSGFTTVLTPTQWRGVAAFAKAVGGEVVLSSPTSPGTRDTAGVWQSGQLEALLRQSREMGIPVAAVAFMNEPNLIGGTGAPKDYGIAEYARDYTRFASAVRRVAPRAKLLGPGAVGGKNLDAIAAAGGLRTLPARDLIAATRHAVDVYNYHHYGSVSQRCATSGPLSTTLPDALDPAWLARTEDTFRFHAGLRAAHAPRAPIWVTETAQAACGGSPWAATFADTPRYVDQLGRLARLGVKAVFHNTLAASDYALLDERDFAPRPNYWAALLWARLADPRVLDLPSPAPTLRTYAHCLKDVRGGVMLVAINLENERQALAFGGKGLAYSLGGADAGKGVALNGNRLALDESDRLPAMPGCTVAGAAEVEPGGVTFVALPRAGNRACR